MVSLTVRDHFWRLIFIYLQLARRVTLGDGDLYTRHDRDAYLAARYDAKGGGRDGDPSSVEDRIRKIRGDDGDDGDPHDDPNKCTTYLAQSSIPNSGLGMYTTVPYRKGEAFPFPEIGVLLQEKQHHFSFSSKKKKDGSEKLLNQYPWASSVLTLGNREVGYGETIVPGLGMLANSHLGLVNMRHSELWKVQPWRDGTDSLHRPETLTMDDAGRGAHSPHGRVVFEANAPVALGEELFVSYGDDWFVGREKLLGAVPGESHFKQADEMLQKFSEEVGEEGRGDDFAYRNAQYEQLLNVAQEGDKRLRMALPNNMRDVPTALEMGTARFSARDSIRPMEWLEENGACIDNIVAGMSTIPQAGRGAFATRSLKEGQPITTTPVVTLERDELHLWEKVKETEEGKIVLELVGEQLLLNYCYGHTNSSLLFFPYAPSVNFINHGSLEDRNAEIRWSDLPYHKAEWLDGTLEEAKDRLKTGLLFDIVATRDIRRGEEVLLYYGKEWEEGWDEHVREWASTMDEGGDGDDDRPPPRNLTERLGVPIAHDLNRKESNPVVRTEGEQADNPYPPHLQTVCRFKPPETCPSIFTAIGDEPLCRSRWEVTFDALHLHPCTILSRETVEGVDWYSARVEEVPAGKEEGATAIPHMVEYMTRDAIMFADRPYSRDQYTRGAFRLPIGLPDGIVPPHWLDLDGEKGEVGDALVEAGEGVDVEEKSDKGEEPIEIAGR